MKRTVTHEIKLEKSLKVILLVFAIAIFANAFQFSWFYPDSPDT